jgi:hypothetical protein
MESPFRPRLLHLLLDPARCGLHCNPARIKLARIKLARINQARVN